MAFSPKQRTATRSSWDHGTAMLASSIMMLSISEESASPDIGFNSRLASGGSFQGWGSQTGRMSCKVDLYALGQSNPKSLSSQQSSSGITSSSDEEDEAWGFFDSS